MTTNPAPTVCGTINRTADLDADYERAIGIMIRANRVSTSFVSRSMGIGYNAAARLVERAEADGIVTRPNEVGKRSLAAIHPASTQPIGYMAPDDGYNRYGNRVIFDRPDKSTGHTVPLYAAPVAGDAVNAHAAAIQPDAEPDPDHIGDGNKMVEAEPVALTPRYAKILADVQDSKRRLIEAGFGHLLDEPANPKSAINRRLPVQAAAVDAASVSHLDDGVLSFEVNGKGTIDVYPDGRVAWQFGSEKGVDRPCRG
ncbi:DNA translocase FtsK [Paracoccus aminophilus]|uniref:FtsK gamma domain-containing protein n=1 Tax=Paracoccus aminophilus JCM 7686 TaxID=1367847 RepID=S5Y984_PARAH|nr:DNA translocase FtsK [Paracoccus aminophilus]AGT07923.1 hypothetical protein JCM7686_0814 [Paracoccus aminophilus JCM 7686]